jgi:nucleoside-diphosphate-sugar epimerase
LECEVLFLGFGPITHALASKFIAQNHKVIVVTDKSLFNDPEDHFPIGNFQKMNWSDALTKQIDAESTFIGWRKPPQGDEITSWVKSLNLKTRKLHHLSSASVYEGNKVKFSEMDFDFRKVREPKNDKQALEKLVGNIGIEKEVKFVNYRISNVYGVGLNHGFINESINNVRNNLPVKVFRNLDLVRDYLLLDDLISALLQLRLYEPLPEILNISTGQGTLVSEVVNQLNTLRANDLKLLEVDSPMKLKQKSVLSCKELEEIINWKPKRLDDALKNLI